MTTLPIRPLATDTVEVFGEDITVRALSRSEALKVTTQFDKDTADDAEAFILSCAIDCTEDEARDWLSKADMVTAGRVLDRVLELSNLKPMLDEDGEPKDPKSDGSKRS